MTFQPVEWTPEMVARLIDGQADGIGTSLLADEIGVARNTLRKQRDKLGLAPLPRGDAKGLGPRKRMMTRGY
jgi:hypothetical protein